MAEESIGSKLNNEVIAQIEARKAIVGKLVGRTNDDLLYLNSKTGWVRLSSGINTITDEEAAQFLDQKNRLKISGDGRLAEYNVLQGGIQNPNRTIRQGINTNVTTEADNITLSDKAAYQNRANSTGIRPMPGITGVTIQSKNTFGTLREAEVKLMVWTLEDFEMVERIYLRPGFTMLLEWGHSLYVNNNGSIEKNIPSVGNKFFATNIKMSQILDEISQYRKSTDYNYEGMIGYVKNFSWNYRPDGAYECTVNIISTGEILDSLKMRINPKLKIDIKEFASSNSERGKEQQKSPFHFFFSKLDEITSAKFTNEDLRGISPTLYNKLQPFTGYYKDIQSEDHPDARWYWDKHIKHYWMPLRVYLDMFNNFLVHVDSTKQSTDPNYAIVKFNIDYEKSSKFVTIPEHFSIDPSTCVLAHKHVKPVEVEGQVFGDVSVIVNNLDSEQKAKYDDVLNILVPTPYVKGILDAAFGEDYESEKGATEIIQEILGGINTALGGINDLSITYDEDYNGGTFFIIDRNNTPTEEPPTLTVAGIDSIFTDLSISSKLSNEVGSQISIAAQGSAQTFSENVQNILHWNPNVIDRVRPIKDDRTTKTTSEGIEQLKKDQRNDALQWFDKVVKFFNEFNTTGYQDVDVQAARTQHKDYIARCLYTDNLEKKTTPLPGLVPVELSLQLEGIGGIKLAQTFKIKSGILPAKYQDRFGYLITGIGHSIENNKWLTNIKTQFYPIDRSQPRGIPAGQTRQGPPVDFTRAGASPTSTVGGGTSKTIEGVTYRNGQMPDNKLRSINNPGKYRGAIQSDGGKIRLYTKASKALDDLLAAAESANITLKINSAYRTLQDQQRVYSKNCTADGICTPPTARPGSSNHGFGIAVDFANKSATKMSESMPEYKWLAANGPKFGFRRIRSEAWHWEYQNIS
jgi:hypothetical protein